MSVENVTPEQEFHQILGLAADRLNQIDSELEQLRPEQPQPGLRPPGVPASRSSAQYRKDVLTQQRQEVVKELEEKSEAVIRRSPEFAQDDMREKTRGVALGKGRQHGLEKAEVIAQAEIDAARENPQSSKGWKQFEKEHDQDIPESKQKESEPELKSFQEAMREAHKEDFKQNTKEMTEKQPAREDVSVNEPDQDEDSFRSFKDSLYDMRAKEFGINREDITEPEDRDVADTMEKESVDMEPERD